MAPSFGLLSLIALFFLVFQQIATHTSLEPGQADMVTLGLASWLLASPHSILPNIFHQTKQVFSVCYLLHAMSLFRKKQTEERHYLTGSTSFLWAWPSRSFTIWFQTYLPNVQILPQSPRKSSLYLSDWSTCAICIPITQWCGWNRKGRLCPLLMSAPCSTSLHLPFRG